MVIAAAGNEVIQYVPEDFGNFYDVNDLTSPYQPTFDPTSLDNSLLSTPTDDILESLLLSQPPSTATQYNGQQHEMEDVD